ALRLACHLVFNDPPTTEIYTLSLHDALPICYLREHEGNWPGWSPTWMLGRRLTGKRLGIVGMGRIGQAVAARARPFGLEIHYHNRKPANAVIEQELGATFWENLDDMLGKVDIVSVNCPLTPQTFHLRSEE